jgi:hypothetical protein
MLAQYGSIADRVGAVLVIIVPPLLASNIRKYLKYIGMGRGLRGLPTNGYRPAGWRAPDVLYRFFLPGSVSVMQSAT